MPGECVIAPLDVSRSHPHLTRAVVYYGVCVCVVGDWFNLTWPSQESGTG